MHCALGVATLSVAALESYANEMYFEASIIGDALPPAAAAELVALIDKESVLRKYSMALAVRTGKTLNLGCATLQDADALIRLRNAVVHFRPEWFGEKEKHDKLSVRLKGRFEHSKVLPNDPLFPRAWATASFSQWALRSAVGFLDYFYGEIGLPCPLNGFRERLSQLSGNVL